MPQSLFPRRSPSLHRFPVRVAHPPPRVPPTEEERGPAFAPFAPHLVAFVRAPRMGRVKSRLAAHIGTVAACHFYRMLTAAVLRRLAGRGRWHCWLAVTPDTEAANPTLWPGGWQPIPQGGGDLGQRMGRVFASLPPGPVVIVGTDIPDIGPAHVARAFRALGAHDAVFGPATDGGYWLVGARRRPALPRNLFRGVRWSSAHALADTLANLKGRRVAFVDELSDVDTGADFAAWRRGRQRTETAAATAAFSA